MSRGINSLKDGHNTMYSVSIRWIVLAGIAAALVSNPSGHAEEIGKTPAKTAKTSVFNERWLDAVVSIEQVGEEEKSEAIGTGFLLQTAKNHILLMTAKHVISDDTGAVRKNLGFLLNRPDRGTDLVLDKNLAEKQLGTWFVSASYDIACRFIALPKTTTVRTIPQSAIIRTSDLNAGAPLLLLGFPLGNRSTDHARAIARSGMVARADADGIIADAFVFPGNSGGPAVYVPVVKVGGGMTSSLINEEKLVGVVSNYIAYPDVAISSQTKRPRIIFEENSGLANLVPGDAIIDLLNRSDVAQKDAELTLRDLSP